MLQNTMISNFQYVARVGDGPLNWRFIGTVDVTKTSGVWWWKKSETTTLDVVRKYADLWRWGLTGSMVDLIIEDLVHAWEFKHSSTLESHQFEEDNE